MVSDFGPGHDAEGGFQRAFKAAGGEIVGSVRMAVANPDFSAYRAARQGPQSGIDLRLRAGRRAAGRRSARRSRERGVDPKKIKIMGTGEVTDDQAIKSMGDAALGIITAWHYDHNHDFEDEQGLRRRVQDGATGVNPELLLGRRL